MFTLLLLLYIMYRISMRRWYGWNYFYRPSYWYRPMMFHRPMRFHHHGFPCMGRRMF
ncbi:MAG: hypothetical protein IKX97_02570 [Erysipelotrichaceae bacterium]|nr:hypothetical protein [Erysipelotrichaceae bacterium]